MKVFVITRWDNPNMDIMIEGVFRSKLSAQRYFDLNNFSEKWASIREYELQ